MEHHKAWPNPTTSPQKAKATRKELPDSSSGG
jgi:hypothetical protein